MRSLIIHNLYSGFGSNAIFEFERELVRSGDECVMRTLLPTTSVADLLLDAEEFDLIIISGGDGTVTNALYALRNRNVPSCVFPSGTANLLFANLGNGPEPAAIAKACHELDPTPLDIGELRWTDESGQAYCEGFGIMSGMGFDAELMASAEAGKQALGEAAYFTAVLANLKPKIASFTITVDGKTYQRQGISCIVANAAMMQGDINIIPECRMDDGKLDVMVLTTTAAVQLLIPVLAGLIDPDGSLIGRPGIERFSGKQITVQSSIPLHIQRDGDSAEGLVTGYEASCLPGSNLVIVDEHSPYRKKA